MDKYRSTQRTLGYPIYEERLLAYPATRRQGRRVSSRKQIAADFAGESLNISYLDRYAKKIQAANKELATSVTIVCREAQVTEIK